MRQKKYDIFISYRRSSYDTANLIATRLKSAGYSVFFDMETLRSGKFNEQLYNVIENCTDFLVVLPPGALDRCVNEDDWVRLEVQHALRNKKNIIPIMLNGFQWPEPMPEGMEELCEYQALTANSVEYFDLSMERLQTRYLQSRRHFMFHKFARFIAVSVVSLLVLTALLWCVFLYLSKDVCTFYATQLVKDASNVHLLAMDNATLKKEWLEFENAFKYDASGKKAADMREKMEYAIDFAKNNVKKTSELLDSASLEIGAYHSFLLALNGINAQEIAYSPFLAKSYFNDYIESLSGVSFAVEEMTTLAVKGGSVHFVAFDHIINAYYASVLEVLSEFPESSLEQYKEMSKMWTLFPRHYKFGEDKEYYKELARNEMEVANKELAEYSAALEHFDAGIKDFERDNNTPGELNDRMVKIDEDMIQFYEEMKAEYRFVEGDEQFHKWTKCYFTAQLMMIMAQSQQIMYEDGFNFQLSITPEIVYNDVAMMLDEYVREFPESKAYVSSAKAFFKAVSKNECEYAGVILFAFKDNVSHPTLKVGDIIFSYDGKKIMSIEELGKAYSMNNAGRVKVYRLINGKLETVEIPQLTDVDIIGMLNLVVRDEEGQEQ